ncbi:hypothetical protein [Pyrococcus yayanosii]|uniref:Uncharacterized protein n=1 Tax=Pyrococcus yayanosii (strain CH1 / JCM 16557) TaxID=529709 RepID=F8AIY3_PYRYC|nr:hypothetical protein [Pyrococcus yayanosii]AEH24458.1 hypothetical protein PYCH_07710 [Pyrococcus yayanosii CH1]
MPVIRVPYVLFRTASGIYGIDAYTSLRVERPERAATLIRRAEGLRPVQEKPENALLSLEEVEAFLTNLLELVKEHSGSIMKERVSKMRRWNIFRLLGIPTGHSRHIAEEERLAKENREALLALSLLENVLRGRVKPLGYAILELEVRGREVMVGGRRDGVYTELTKIDMRAAMALAELISAPARSL